LLNLGNGFVLAPEQWKALTQRIEQIVQRPDLGSEQKLHFDESFGGLVVVYVRGVLL